MSDDNRESSVNLQPGDGDSLSQTPVLHLAVYGTLMRGRSNHERFCSGYLSV